MNPFPGNRPMIRGVLQAPADTDCGTNEGVALPVTLDFHANDGSARQPAALVGQ